MIEYPGLPQLWAVLPEARIAGGAVRDFLAGRQISDIDLASPLPPGELIARLNAADIKTIPTGLAHGTVTARVSGRNFEITTLRRDIATDGRHATVAFTDDWREDAARRDFTINAMSMDQTGAIFDYFEGQADLRAAKLRFVGDAYTRITEDYLRILRFFRFYARYANGEPDPAAITAITILRDGVLGLSAERIWAELKRILAAPDPGSAIALMQSTGILDRVLSDGTNLAALNGLIARGAPADPLLRLAALQAGDVTSLSARLKLSNDEFDTLTTWREPNGLTTTATDADLRRALADTAADALIARTWLAEGASTDWAMLRERVATTPRPIFPLQGRDLAALGIPPGPRMGKILATIRAWWLAAGCTPDHEACLMQALLTNPK